MDFKKQDFEMIKQKMKDPNFVRNMRQEVIESVYKDARYETSFKLNHMNGSDALVMAVDNLIEA